MRWLTDSEITATIPECVARENLVVPVLRVGGPLVVAAPNPHAEQLQQKLSFILEQPVCLIARDSDWILAKINAVFSSDTVDSDADLQSDGTLYWANWTWKGGSVLCIKTSGFQISSHWSGAIELSLEHPNRAFWDWVVSIDAFNRILTEQEIPALRRLWQ